MLLSPWSRARSGKAGGADAASEHSLFGRRPAQGPPPERAKRERVQNPDASGRQRQQQKEVSTRHSGVTGGEVGSRVCKSACTPFCAALMVGPRLPSNTSTPRGRTNPAGSCGAVLRLQPHFCGLRGRKRKGKRHKGCDPCALILPMRPKKRCVCVCSPKRAFVRFP